MVPWARDILVITLAEVDAADGYSDPSPWTYNDYYHHDWLWWLWDRTIAPGETWTNSFVVDPLWWAQQYDDGTSAPWPAYYRVWGCSASSFIAPGNTVIFVGTHAEPTASFVPSSEDASAGETVTMDASTSLNSAGTSYGLEYRWDWDGDGIFDTEWSSDPQGAHSYTVPGEYTLSLEVRDLVGNTATSESKIKISDVAVPEFAAVACSATLMVALVVLLRLKKR